MLSLGEAQAQKVVLGTVAWLVGGEWWILPRNDRCNMYSSNARISGDQQGARKSGPLSRIRLKTHITNTTVISQPAGYQLTRHAHTRPLLRSRSCWSFKSMTRRLYGEDIWCMCNSAMVRAAPIWIDERWDFIPNQPVLLDAYNIRYIITVQGVLLGRACPAYYVSICNHTKEPWLWSMAEAQQPMRAALSNQSSLHIPRCDRSKMTIYSIRKSGQKL